MERSCVTPTPQAWSDVDGSQRHLLLCDTSQLDATTSGSGTLERVRRKAVSFNLPFRKQVFRTTLRDRLWNLLSQHHTRRPRGDDTIHSRIRN